VYCKEIFVNPPEQTLQLAAAGQLQFCAIAFDVANANTMVMILRGTDS
jgi:hypothetical protein